jgi:hypothetical protein
VHHRGVISSDLRQNHGYLVISRRFLDDVTDEISHRKYVLVSDYAYKTVFNFVGNVKLS